MKKGKLIWRVNLRVKMKKKTNNNKRKKMENKTIIKKAKKAPSCIEKRC